MANMIRDIAHRILADDPDPVVRFRLMRDVLALPTNAPELIHAQQQLHDSKWVRQLVQTQHPDGSWGRFHTADASLKAAIGTTEQAVWRALALGLDSHHPMLVKAAAYCASLLDETMPFPDPAEVNNRWLTGWRLFAASILAQIQPTHPALAPTYDLWHRIAQRTFAEGTYSQQAEVTAHQDLTGATIRGSYLELQNRYSIALLAARGLDTDLEAAYLTWLTCLPDGLHYLTGPVLVETVPQAVGPLERWLSALDILSRFRGWDRVKQGVGPALLLAQQQDGLWDFGKRASWSVTLPYSDDWRQARKRKHDWSLRVLLLLT